MGTDRELSGGDGALRPADAAGLSEAERLCAEVAGELRELLQMLSANRGRIAAAAWCILDPTLASHAEAVELARWMARMAGPEFEAEIEQFLVGGGAKLARPEAHVPQPPESPFACGTPPSPDPLSAHDPPYASADRRKAAV